MVVVVVDVYVVINVICFHGTTLAASTASSPHAALKNVDQGEALGFGANNMITANHLEHRKAVFQSLHSDVLRYQVRRKTKSSSFELR